MTESAAVTEPTTRKPIRDRGTFRGSEPASRRSGSTVTVHESVSVLLAR